MPRLIDADEVIKSIEMQIKLIRGIHSQDNVFQQFATIAEESWRQEIDNAKTVDAIPVDFIWDRAEAYEKQWLEDDNHWCKNVAEALRALLEDWDGEQGGGIFDKYENS